ncbi:response regulator [Paracidobacterium acidisoli]|uniref:DNA-binding response regulator n=1 Tax=Paracidobacterium acidisoli TaxID=2303751 RepID=A0A372IUM5_9BACT|nr:response regulator transcription factor [Paracidobacterium acidisoli]MBT9330098.1 response regulator transcription factor [Paracidobacterium acidisoli]
MNHALASSPIRLVIVDDHPVVRAGLSSMLSRQEDMTLVAEFAGASPMVDFVSHAPVDLVLLDLRMPGMSGIEAIRALRQSSPGTKIVVLSSFEFDEEIYQAVEAGVRGYLLKDMSGDDLMQAIREVYEGQLCFPRRIAQRLEDRKRRANLSPREREILGFVAKGFTNKEIAAALHISQFTVRNHINHLTSKLEVSDRTEAAFFAIQTGILMLSH